MVISAAPIWISMWLSLNNTVVIYFFLLNKLILTMVYTQPADVSLDHHSEGSCGSSSHCVADGYFNPNL